MKKPKRVPKRGFYRHYKHDPKKGITNYSYEILGVGVHTEDECRPEDINMMVYRPLYKDAFVYRAGKLFDLRPLGMFYEKALWKGKKVIRFTLVTDKKLIAKLRKIRDRMYPRQN